MSGRVIHVQDVSTGAAKQRVSRLEEEPLIEPVAFTCQFCSERQEWDTREAADAAAVWHLFEVHPLRWRATAGDRCPTDLPPTRLGQRLTRIGSV
jgi:hypothetical protein